MFEQKEELPDYVRAHLAMIRMTVDEFYHAHPDNKITLYAAAEKRANVNQQHNFTTLNCCFRFAAVIGFATLLFFGTVVPWKPRENLLHIAGVTGTEMFTVDQMCASISYSIGITLICILLEKCLSFFISREATSKIVSNPSSHNVSDLESQTGDKDDNMSSTSNTSATNNNNNSSMSNLKTFFSIRVVGFRTVVLLVLAGAFMKAADGGEALCFMLSGLHLSFYWAVKVLLLSKAARAIICPFIRCLNPKELFGKSDCKSCHTHIFVLLAYLFLLLSFSFRLELVGIL